VEYHTSGPFSNADGVTRFYYYSPPGVPTTWVDGIYEFIGGGTGNYTQYRNAFNIRKNVSSPFIINLDGDFNPQTNSGYIIAEIIAEGIPPSNLWLRYAIVETDIEYTWSGGDTLYFVERDMFPSATGVSISMSQGDTIVDTQSYSFDPEWNFINSYIAVFIQCDTDKEVQQAAKWSIPINVPNISIVDKEIDDSSGDNDGRADPGETVNLILSLYNSPPFMPATNVSATLSTGDPDINITHATSNYPDIPVDSTVDNSSDPFTFSVDPGASVHRVQFILNISAQPNNYSDSDTFELMIGRPDIIFIDNDAGDPYGNVESYFTGALESLGVGVYDVAYNTSIEMQHLDEYAVVVWFTGALDSGTVTGNDQALLSAYLDGGGKLFITGQDIGKDIGGTSFYSNYLHAVFKTDDVNFYGILGIAGDPIGDGLNLTITGAGGANNQSSPSAINKKSESDSCFAYPGTLGPCAVRYSGSYQTVYFSFGFEAINDESKRVEVLRRILVWFGYLQGIEEEPSHGIAQSPVISISPNPFVSEMRITLKNISYPQVEIQDVTGRVVWSAPNTANSEITWDGHDFSGRALPSGIYFCNVKSGNKTVKTDKVILVR
jgi:hypothetical protein